MSPWTGRIHAFQPLPRSRVFARSHAPNMATYLVGDILAGAAAHLLCSAWPAAGPGQ